MPKLLSLWILYISQFSNCYSDCQQNTLKECPIRRGLRTHHRIRLQISVITIRAGSQHVIFLLGMDTEGETTYWVGIDRSRAVSLCVKIILDQVEIKANVLSPHLLLKLRDVEISEIKFTAALVASNKKSYLILHKQKRGMFWLVGRKERVEHANNGRGGDVVAPPGTFGIMAPNVTGTISLCPAFWVLSTHWFTLSHCSAALYVSGWMSVHW